MALWKGKCEMIYMKKFKLPESGEGSAALTEDIEDADEKKKRLPGRKKHQIEHQAGLELLAYGLRREYGLSFPDISSQLQKGEGGKPYLPDYPQIHFNISHSGSMAVCALGNHPLGVDIEQIRPARLRATRRILTEREREFLAGCPKERKDLEFFKLWTLKESYGKALGIGLALDFTKVEFSFGGPEGEEICMRRFSSEDQNEKPAWKFTQTLWEKEYVIAFCGQETPGGLILV